MSGFFKKQSAVEKQERYEILCKFTQFNQYFAYLPYILYPTSNHLIYSNANLNNILVALKYGDIDNDPLLATQRKLYLSFLKEYDQNVKQFVNQQQMKIQKVIKNEDKAEVKKNKKNANNNKKKRQFIEQMSEVGWTIVSKKPQRQRYVEKQEERNQFDKKKKVYVEKKYALSIETSQDCINVQNLQQYEQLVNFKEKYGLNFNIQLIANQQ